MTSEPQTPQASAPGQTPFDVSQHSLAAGEKLGAFLAARPRALLTDIDGTLSPIAPTPAAATLLPGVADLLTRATGTFDLVAAISGRAAPDARRMVGVDTITYVGNHGLEELAPGAEEPVVVPEAVPLLPRIAEVLGFVEHTLGPLLPGLRVERKGVTGSIHVRQTEDPERAEEAVMALLKGSTLANGLLVTRGRMVVEVRPPVGVDKGTAIAELAERHGLRGAVYLGDDRTDIDAFRALSGLTVRGTLVGVRVAVLHAEAPAGLAESADLALPSIMAVPGFLTWLLAQAESTADA